ncbi:MAG TPA: ATP-binding protein, partial [Candidatus Bathyarchaeia archaeon]|nr:ATP-binding protein [Candidatus Bathyarchaeia archaeon]
TRQAYGAFIRSASAGKPIVRKKVILQGKANKKIDAWLSVIFVRSTQGRAPCIDVIVENLTLQHRAQVELADSKELFRLVFNNSAVAILVTDEQKRIIAWNPFAMEMLGMGREELFNRPAKELYPEDEWKKIIALYSRKKGVVSDIETQVVTARKKNLDVNLSVSAIRNVEGKIVGTIAIMHDVSLQKKTQRMLLNAKKAAEAASEAKTMFLANMSHEVRTPMNTIMGMVDLTLDTELTPEQRDNLSTVKNAADILLTLLNDILDLSRVEAGKIQLESIEVNIERTVRSVCKTMDILAKNKSLALQWLIDESVPDMVKGDPVRIRQILVNLINNAIKFTPKGKIQVEVKTDSKDENSCVLHFLVKDEGIGIEKDKQEKIFEAFTQEDVSTTRQFGGTGLGLAICRRLLELMGGRIWVESVKGEGSTFHFIIPCPIVHKEEVPEAMQEESIESQLMAQIARKKTHDAQVQKTDLHILLAEDNIVNQKMTQKILEKKGWHVTVANNGQEVLTLFAGQQAFDLILMDAQMPVMDGFAATQEIRKREANTGKRIPIVALTARAMAGDRKKCMECGMDGYVSKPIDRAQLYESIESFFVT